MSTKSVKSLIVISFLVAQLERSIAVDNYEETLVPNSDILPLGTVKLATSVLRILCHFHANFIHVYIEIGASLDLTEFILKNLNKCGTTVLTLGYDSTDEGITLVNNDGIMMYMLLILDAADEPINLSYLRKKSADKHRSFFVILVESSDLITIGWLRETFHRFWDRWFLNVIIVFWERDLGIYTFTPFSRSFLKKLSPNTFRKEDLFAMNILNMRKHQLRISLYPEEVRAVFLQNNRLRGTDGFMADLIANRMNATKVIVVPEDNYSGEIYSNNSADGSIGYIIRDEVDVALNTRYLLPQKFQRKVENTYVYGRDDLCVMVPASALRTPLFNIFRSFDRDVWTFVLVIPFFVYFMLRLLNPDAHWNFLIVLGGTVRNTVGSGPYANKFRLIFAIWLMYSFVIVNFYEGNLTSNIVLPRMTSPVDTIQQLVDSPLQILIYKRFAPHIHQYLNSSKAAQLELKKRIRAVSDKYFQDRLNANDLSKAYIDKFHITSYRVGARSHTYRGRPLFHKMAECPVPFYTVYVVPYGSPFLGYINKILRHTQEHGFILYWDKYMEVNSKLSGKFIVLHKRREDDLIVIELVHLQIAMYMLLLGWCISSFIFLLELCMRKKGREDIRASKRIDLTVFDHIKSGALKNKLEQHYRNK